jgi:preprotein translocase subunit YajC
MLTVFMPLAQFISPGGAPATGAAPAPAPEGPAPAGATTVTATTQQVSTTQDGAAAQPQQPGSGMFTLVMMVVMLGALYFFLMRPQRKEEKRRKAMIAELKRGDRVMTIGGMLAKVVSVDNDEVVLKIDEAANVKATYRKSAIQEVIDRDEKK